MTGSPEAWKKTKHAKGLEDWLVEPRRIEGLASGDDLPVFEEEDVAPGPGARAAPALRPGSAMAEHFRVLREKLRAIAAERPFRCFGVVSAMPGDGTTTVSLGLANAMAQEHNRRTLLLEAHLREPALEGRLGLSRETGVREFLEGASTIVKVRRLRSPDLSLLVAGIGGSEFRPELLGTARMAHLIESARRLFDIVVVDCPPLVPAADSVILQDLLDGFLFVVRHRHSRRETVRKAAALLKPERVAGVVFNDIHMILGG